MYIIYLYNVLYIFDIFACKCLRSHILKVFRPIHFVMFCYAVVLYNNLKPYILHMFDFSGIFIKLHKI